MSTATAIRKSAVEAEGDQCVEFPAIGWKGYLTLLRLRGERSRPRMVYLDGTVWLMSPTFPHERLKKRLGWVVEVIVEELDIPCTPAASTTFRRRAKKGGVEGDETYYLANEERIRGKNKIDLRTDPPPDLAIEAVHSHDADAAVEGYRRIRVPEVWICDEAELVILVLQPEGRYARSPTSATFPFLSAADVYAWASRPQTEQEMEWVKAFRRWVRRTLKPRFRRRAGGPP
jgi:Uma2 family endonuclease